MDNIVTDLSSLIISNGFFHDLSFLADYLRKKMRGLKMNTVFSLLFLYLSGQLITSSSLYDWVLRILILIIGLSYLKMDPFKSLMKNLMCCLVTFFTVRFLTSFFGLFLFFSLVVLFIVVTVLGETHWGISRKVSYDVAFTYIKRKLTQCLDFAETSDPKPKNKNNNKKLKSLSQIIGLEGSLEIQAQKSNNQSEGSSSKSEENKQEEEKKEEEKEEDVEVSLPTIILLGKTGSGKSFLGSKIAKFCDPKNDKAFHYETRFKPKSCTQSPQECIVQWKSNNIIDRVRLIDTQGIQDSNKSEDEIMLDLGEYLRGMRKRIDLVLYCHKVDDRFESNMRPYLELLHQYLGPTIFKHTFFALTKLDLVAPGEVAETIREYEAELKEFCKEADYLKALGENGVLNTLDLGGLVVRIGNLLDKKGSFIPNFHGIDLSDHAGLSRTLENRGIMNYLEEIVSKLEKKKEEDPRVDGDYKTLKIIYQNFRAGNERIDYVFNKKIDIYLNATELEEGTLIKDIRDLLFEFKARDDNFWVRRSEYEKAALKYVERRLPFRIFSSVKIILTNVSLEGLESLTEIMHMSSFLKIFEYWKERCSGIYKLIVLSTFLLIYSGIEFIWKKNAVIERLYVDAHKRLSTNPQIKDFFKTLQDSISAHFLNVMRKYMDRNSRNRL